MTDRKKLMIAAIVGSVLLMGVPAYQPLKFQYAIWRIESAKNLSQEKSACILASRAGSVWEVNQIHRSEFQFLPKRINPGTNECVTEIEWWESPWWRWGGTPYRAYRTFLDPKNREILTSRSEPLR